jgi:S1-C subfamily serine protease
MEFLLGGDIITEINGQPLDGPEKFMKLIRSLQVGDKWNLTLYREMKTRKVELTLPERPILPGDLPPDTPRYQMSEPNGGAKSSNKP